MRWSSSGYYGTTNMSKDFEAYPIRHIRLSNEEWEELKTAKIASGKTWNNFIKALLKQLKQDL